MLRECPECTRDYSTSAERCPHCGFQDERFIPKDAQPDEPAWKTVPQAKEPMDAVETFFATIMITGAVGFVVFLVYTIIRQ